MGTGTAQVKMLLPLAGCQRLTLVILATQEAEIKKITKKSAGGVAKGDGPEFKPQYRKTKNKKHSSL
jgi:hypothetical protein